MEKEWRFDKPEKPELETLKIKVDLSNFQNPDKAEALIKSLDLNINDEIREDDEDRFTINPKMVLKGNAPNKYKLEIEEVKKILTENEKKSINLYYRKKKEDSKTRDKIYYGITKRVDRLYNWDNENKKHIPKKETKRNIEICKSLDIIHNADNFHGFHNLIYHILSKEKQDFVYCYKCAWFNKEIPNIQEWREENEGEYWVLTENEADYQAEEYLTDDPYLWECAVKEGYTTEGLQEWAKDVINIDGRGSVLNGYDGIEEQEEINGVYYCIYRTN